MVSLAASADYTHQALESFSKTTLLAPEDSFHLIANDHHKVEFPHILQRFTRVHLLDNPSSFAENGNLLRKLALESGSDLYFLNNDIIFTPLWSEFLAIKEPVIAIPLCNQDLQYQEGNFKLEPAMDLSDYLGSEEAFEKIAKEHQQKTKGVRQTLFSPFFCVRIPYEVLERVGEFDTSFGKGGAEDHDYSLRTILAGSGVYHSLRCYLLHFMGRSTWRGGESPEETKTRDGLYLKRFEEKWGAQLTSLCIKRDTSFIQQDEKLRSLAENNQWAELIRSVTPPETLQSLKQGNAV